jgi:hypothetical protein
MRTIRRRRASVLFLGATAALATAALASRASAQTWTEGRTTPSGLELVAVDATGELFWPYGAEDLAADGDSFEQPERAIDLRTAYAATDAQRFWARLYVSDTAAPATTLIGFVFVDSDASAATGGTAAATDVHPGLGADPSGGGYEAVLVLRRDVAPVVWTWNAGPDRWEQAEIEPEQVATESGVDEDPIRAGLGGDDHGYLQGNAEHALLGAAATCSVRLFVRSVVDAGGGDADLGVSSPCEPLDANADGVPDNAVPASCDADDDCPFDGICQNGACQQTELCDDPTDCDADEDCSLDGRCVVRPGGSCTDDTTCSSRLCVNGACGTCTLGGNECGAGRRCGADGRCVDGADPGAGATGASSGAGGGDGLGGDVQGGACTCDLVGARGTTGALGEVGGLAALVAIAWTRRRRAPRARPRAGKVRS